MITIQTRHRVGVLLTAICVILMAVGCSQPQATPQAQATNQPANDAAEAVLQAYRDYGGEVKQLDPTTPTISVNVTGVVGTTPASTLTQGNPPCAGFVQSVPSLVFTLDKDASAMEVAFAGDIATTLIVAAEGEEIICDASAPITLTPKLAVPKPGAGRYGVWIGRTDMQKPINGVLTVSVRQ